MSKSISKVLSAVAAVAVAFLALVWASMAALPGSRTSPHRDTTPAVAAPWTDSGTHASVTVPTSSDDTSPVVPDLPLAVLAPVLGTLGLVVALRPRVTGRRTRHVVIDAAGRAPPAHA